MFISFVEISFDSSDMYVYLGYNTIWKLSKRSWDGGAFKGREIECSCIKI